MPIVMLLIKALYTATHAATFMQPCEKIMTGDRVGEMGHPDSWHIDSSS